MSAHPYRPLPTAPSSVPSAPAWRRLLATLARAVPLDRRWVRRAQGGHWSCVVGDHHYGPWTWECGLHTGATCSPIWCEDHGPVVPPLRVSWRAVAWYALLALFAATGCLLGSVLVGCLLWATLWWAR